MNSQNIFDVFGKQKQSILNNNLPDLAEFTAELHSRDEISNEIYLKLNRLELEKTLYFVKNDENIKTLSAEIKLIADLLERNAEIFRDLKASLVAQKVELNEKIRIGISSLEKKDELIKENHDRIESLKLKSDSHKDKIIELNSMFVANDARIDALKLKIEEFEKSVNKIENFKVWKVNINNELQDLIEKFKNLEHNKENIPPV